MKLIRGRVSDLQVQPAGKARPLLDHADNLDVGVIGRVEIQRKVKRCVPCIAISRCGVELRMYQLDTSKPWQLLDHLQSSKSLLDSKPTFAVLYERVSIRLQQPLHCGHAPMLGGKVPAGRQSDHESGLLSWQPSQQSTSAAVSQQLVGCMAEQCRMWARLTVLCGPSGRHERRLRRPSAAGACTRCCPQLQQP